MKQKKFRLYWVGKDGGGIETYSAYHILEALEIFYNYWQDVPYGREVYSIEQTDESSPTLDETI